MEFEIPRDLDLEWLVQAKRRELELYKVTNEKRKMELLEINEKLKKEILDSVKRLTTLAKTASFVRYLNEWEIRLSERRRQVPYKIETKYRNYFVGCDYLLGSKKNGLMKDFGVYCSLLFKYDYPLKNLIVDEKFLDKLQYSELITAKEDINEERLFKVLREEQKRLG